MKHPTSWNLTRAETDVLDAICEHGKVPPAAKALNLSPATLRSHIRHAMLKAGATNIVLLALTWDRYSRPAERKAA